MWPRRRRNDRGMIDLRDPSLDARKVREALDLAPHPEGGAFREIWRDAPEGGGRGAATSIFFLLEAGASSHWHRVDAAELWIWQAGAPLALEIDGGGKPERIRLGPNLSAGESFRPSSRKTSGRPRKVSAPGRWFPASSRRPSNFRVLSLPRPVGRRASGRTHAWFPAMNDPERRKAEDRRGRQQWRLGAIDQTKADALAL